MLAASSLTDVLPVVARAWEARGGHPLSFSFDATSRLAPQAARGAPADLFLSADEVWMDWLVDEGAVAAGSSRVFATNRLVVVVPSEAPPLARPAELLGVGRIALAGENVPAGRYAREALEASGLWADLAPRVIRGGSVRGALEWVARGEVDAGVVYRSDAAAEPRVRVAFEMPPGSHRPVRYVGAVLRGSQWPDEASAFLAFLTDTAAASLFADAGFGGAAAPRASPMTPTLPDVASAIRLSLVVGLLAALFGLVPAVGLGWLLARREFRGKSLLSTAVLAPLVLPPVVTGFLLLSFLGTNTVVGGWLEGLGLPVPFTLVGATLAALVVGLPLYVLSVRGAFEAVDPHYEDVSWTLGVPPSATFRRVSLPLALPGIAAGAVLAFARALGEFGATVVLAGNVEGSTRTIALAVYTLLESPGGREATWVLVGASVAVSLAALVGFEALSRRQKQRLERHHGR